MGQMIDENELETLREKAHKWDSICKFLDSLPAYQKWLKSYNKGRSSMDFSETLDKTGSK